MEGVEEVMVVVFLSGHARRAGKEFLLFLPSILDPRKLKGVKTKGGVWFGASPTENIFPTHH